MPPEKQAEYLRLKSQLEHYHRLIEKKTASKETGSKTSVKKSNAAASSGQLAATNSGQSKKQQNLRASAGTPEVSIASASAKRTAETADTTCSVASPSTLGEIDVPIIKINTSEKALESDPNLDAHKPSVQSNESVGASSSKKAIGSTRKLNGSRRNSVDEMLKGILDSADEDIGQDVELQDINEAKLLASDEESDTVASTISTDVVEENHGPGMEPMEIDTVQEKPFVVDAAKQREELYLREKLLKAQLLKKMEASNDRLKLRKLERDIVSSR